MRLRTLVILFVLVLTQAACASYGKITPLSGGDNQQIVRDGQESLISKKQNTTVIVGAVNDRVRMGTRGNFLIAVHNGGARPFDISTSHIVARDVTQPMAEVALKVFTYGELVQEERKRQAWAALAAGLSAMGRSMQASTAGYRHQSGTFNSTAYDNYGNSYYGYGNYSGTTYDYGAAQAAQMQANAMNQAEFARVAAEGQRQLSELRNSILKHHTVLPGEWYGGIIKIAVPELEEGEPGRVLRVSVSANDTRQDFEFSFQKTK